MRVAIVCDWLMESGGGERVVAELAQMYPKAPIYTSYASPRWRRHYGDRLRLGYLQHWPFSKLRKFLPALRAIWFSRLDLSDYDLVISSSGAEAKGVRVQKPAVHINYCYTPTHYYWSRYEEYMRAPGFGWADPLARLGLRLMLGPMRRWDLKAAQRPDYMIAISRHISGQIKKYYGREAPLIHPPVDTDKFRPKDLKQRHGFLIAGRQTPYKRFDLAVRACTQLNLPLSVIGDGPENHRLRKMAGPSVKFTGHISDDERIEYFQSAEGFIFPAVDDFGIVPVEALAAGTPVIAFRGGGALDYVNDKTGLFFDEQTIDSLAAALKGFDARHYKAADLVAQAEQFSPQRFRSEISSFVQKKVTQK